MTTTALPAAGRGDLAAWWRDSVRAGHLLRTAPLAAILAAQALLSANLIHLGIASGDESLYIYSGHQLIHELFHGGGSPYYETYFSGAPVLYPVLAAMADAVGGLVAARLMSLACMLIATVLLYATGRRLFGYWPAVTGAALFAVLGVSRYLGSYATFDAMALMLMAAAAYCGVRAADDYGAASRWLLLVPAALLTANAMKYASMLFDPVVIGLAALQIRDQGWRRACLRAVALSGATATALAIALALAGTAYLKGVMVTTVNRSGGALFGQSAATPGSVLLHSWAWVGAVVCLSAASLVVALLARERRYLPLLAPLVAAGTLVTLENMRLQSLTSLNKHDDFGAWFACMAAGYALARLAELSAARRARALLLVVLGAVPAAAIGYADGGQAAGFMTILNSGIPRIEALQQYVRPGPQHYLISYYSDVAYDLRPSLAWQQVIEHNYIKYPVPGHPGRYELGVAGFEAAIHDHWFAVVSFQARSERTWDSWDQLELKAVESTPGYRLASQAGGLIFIYRPDYRQSSR